MNPIEMTIIRNDILGSIAQGTCNMIRIDEIWLSTQPMDMRAGMDTASPELLSHVLVSKYADHLPLYRQRLIFLRAGVGLSRSTLSNWIGRCGVELEPLANALKTSHLAAVGDPCG